MKKHLNKTENFAWMPLTGFDKDLPDKGVSIFLERANEKIDGVCLFAFHPDIINQHQGMEKEIILPPDNCSYFANPYNEERRRQEWTNYDLKELCHQLAKRGVDCFLSIMGSQLNDKFHHEFITDHPELKCSFRDGEWNLNVLKRFKDGSYYQDYFAEKTTQVMLDYGFTGIHIADNFCPQPASLYYGDFSQDILEQFCEQTGYSFPQEILCAGKEDVKTTTIRGDYIWKNIRVQWIKFISNRWANFWEKICNAVHKINGKVFVLGMYCTDPFTTLYTKGVDLRKIVNSGVDYVMPNMHANASLLLRSRPWRYYEWANMIPFTDAFTDNGKKINMLTVKDSAEEWDILHHAPTLLERDIYMLPCYTRYTSQGLKRCLDGFNICLADGLYEQDWKWLNERIDVAFEQLPKKILTPTVVWSDHAFDNMLEEYVKTRRWTTHKTVYELNKMGAVTSSIVRIQDLNEKCGDLLVANFDLLSKDEQQKIANYKGGRVIATATALNFNKDDYPCDIYFEDKTSPLKLCAFGFNINGEVDNEQLQELLLDQTHVGGIEDHSNVKEIISTLNEFMPFERVSLGFLKALAKLLNYSAEQILECTHPVIPMQMQDGRIRVYALNDDLLHYGKAIVTIKAPIKKVQNVSKFPLLPVKFSDKKQFGFTTQDYPGDQRTFRLLIPQGGVSIVDVYLKK